MFTSLLYSNVVQHYKYGGTALIRCSPADHHLRQTGKITYNANVANVAFRVQNLIRIHFCQCLVVFTEHRSSQSPPQAKLRKDKTKVCSLSKVVTQNGLWSAVSLEIFDADTKEISQGPYKHAQNLGSMDFPPSGNQNQETVKVKEKTEFWIFYYRNLIAILCER